MGTKKIKRHIVFLFNGYYPIGGWDDMRGSFDTFDEASAFACEARDDDGHQWSYQQIVDLETGKVTMLAEPPKFRYRETA